MVSYAPILIFSHFYGIAIVGLYELSIRILNRPLVIFTTSVTDVFREEVIKETNETGNAKSIFLKTAKGLLILSVMPFSILFFYAEELFSLVFGNDWIISGSIAKSLIPMYWSRFIISPLSYVFIVAKKQGEAAVWNTTISFLSVTILLTGSIHKIDITQTLLILSITYLMYYILLFIRSYKIA
jgi:O-antigen/teichoic acid export membrane protein